MNIFVIGLPKSGRTTIAKSLSNNLGFTYLSALNCIKDSFKSQNSDQSSQLYIEEFNKYFFDQLKFDPDFCIKKIVKNISYQNNHFIIDGISSPRDFISLFDYNKDVVVILNRTDNDSYHRDYDNLLISTIKDYCFWLASVNLIDKSRWLEFNFKLNADTSDVVKVMGSKNSVFLIKNINRVASYLEEKIKNLIF